MEALRLIMHDDLNDRIRIRLRENGFKFCDARQLPDAQPSIDIQRQYQEAPELILEGLNASSTDHEGQSIRETLTEDGEHFWSSTGSASSSFEEHLLYSTAGACNCIQAIGLRVYRATYQYGMPIYPPHYVAFSVGMHPSFMARVPGVFPVLPISDRQIFVLPNDTPPAKLVKIHLIGKQQQQREDALYYHAIQHIEIRGRPVSGASLKDYIDQQWDPHQRCLSYEPHSLRERRAMQREAPGSKGVKDNPKKTPHGFAAL